MAKVSSVGGVTFLTFINEMNEAILMEKYLLTPPTIQHPFECLNEFRLYTSFVL